MGKRVATIFPSIFFCCGGDGNIILFLIPFFFTLNVFSIVGQFLQLLILLSLLFLITLN